MPPFSYEHDAEIRREMSAFRAFMEHIRDVDSQEHTVLMIQVENEIAVFGADRQNRKLWRDHSAAADRLFAEKGFTNDLKYSAWRLSSNWLRRVTDAGAEVYPEVTVIEPNGSGRNFLSQVGRRR